MKRRALGKGLSSLIPGAGSAPPPDADEAEQAGKSVRKKRRGLPATKSAADILDSLSDRSDPDAPVPSQDGPLREIPVSAISPNPKQPRKRIPEESLEELAASIRTTGILQPVLVRPAGGSYELVAGERRWRAAQQAGLESVPAIVRDIPDGELLETALIENIQREELNPIEEARAYVALQENSGLSQDEIADRVGKQRSTVANVQRLLKLPATIRRRVEDGTIPMGHARALLGLIDPHAQEKIAQDIEKKELSVRQVEALVRGITEPKKPSTKTDRPVDPNVASAQEELARHLGTKVSIQQAKSGKGRMVIEFYSNEELIRLFETIQGR